TVPNSAAQISAISEIESRCLYCAAPLPPNSTICNACSAENQRREREYVEKNAEKHREEWLHEIGIPVRYRARLATLAQTPAVTAVKRFCESRAWLPGHARA